MKKLLLALILAFMTVCAAQAATVSNVPFWDGIEYIYNFGETDTATYGQTMSTTGAINLQSVAFYLDDDDGTDAVDFQLVVGTWTGSHVGSVLWQSAMISTTNNNGLGGWEEIVVDTENLFLAGATDYFIFLSASNFFDGDDGYAKVAGTSADTCPVGQFWFMNNGSNFDEIYADGFNTWSLNDMVFTAEYTDASSVPEPSSIVLLLAGFAGLAGFGLKRRNA